MLASQRGTHYTMSLTINYETMKKLDGGAQIITINRYRI